MADVFNRKKRSDVMSRIKGSGNLTTELRMINLFRELDIKGWRRKQDLPGRPDFVFHKLKAVLFVDGCFWHGCPVHGHVPKSNRHYWRQKIIRNKARDRAVSRELRRRGWKVFRVWEHATKKGAIPKRVLAALKAA